MPKNTDTIEFKQKFVDQYKKLTDWNEFRKYSLMYLRRSIRVNTLKISISNLKKRLEKNWNLTEVPWCEEGFWIEHKGEKNKDGEVIKRRDIGNLPEHALGYFYTQEAASMIPPIVLDPKPGELILDMCASPGSKTTQIAGYMKNQGILISNDYTIPRMKPLSLNLQRCGVTNAIISLMEGRWFQKSGLEFDRILVDAPCSGTGTIRKSFKTLKIWNQNMVKRLCATQKQLLNTAYNILKPGGTLVYSTCSLEPHEDEGVISDFLDKNPEAKIEDINLNGLKRSDPILEFEDQTYNKEVKKCLRIWPQDNDTEGFFVAKIGKE